jgi:hypothetical protein
MSDEPTGTVLPVTSNAHEFILWRLTQLEHQYAQLDQNGSRGVDALKLEVHQLATKLGEHETMHEKTAEQAAITRRWQIGITIGVMTTLVSPIYVILLSHFH